MDFPLVLCFFRRAVGAGQICIGLIRQFEEGATPSSATKLMTVLELHIGHSSTPILRKTRAKGSASNLGGWATIAICACGWSSWKFRNQDAAREAFDRHITEPAGIRITRLSTWVPLFSDEVKIMRQDLTSSGGWTVRPIYPPAS